MKESKLVILLQSLAPNEQKQLGLFIHSPFHIRNEEVIKLYGCLSDLLFVKKQAEFSRKDVFGLLFPGREFDDLHIRHLMSYLLKATEECLAQLEFRKQPLNWHFPLISVYRRKGMPKFLAAVLKAARLRFGKNPFRDQQYHQHNYQLSVEEYTASEIRSKKAYQSLQTFSDELDLQYIAGKFKAACSILNHQRIFKVEYEIGLLDTLIAFVEARKLYEHPAIGLYYHTWCMFSDRDSEMHFTSLKKQLQQHLHSFEKEELRTLYLLAINFCIHCINRGQRAYLQEVFNLYRNSLENHIIFDLGKISPWTYKNIVSASIKIEEYAWAESFIKAYRVHLPGLYAEQLYDYNLARVHFARKEFQASIKLLRYFTIEDPFTLLDAKVTLIKAWYELEEFKLIEYQLENLKKLLSRKGLLTYHQKSYNAFIKLTRRLINLKPYDAQARNRLKTRIQDSEILSEKDWLLEKLNA